MRWNLIGWLASVAMMTGACQLNPDEYDAPGPVEEPEVIVDGGEAAPPEVDPLPIVGLWTLDAAEFASVVDGEVEIIRPSDEEGALHVGNDLSAELDVTFSNDGIIVDLSLSGAVVDAAGNEFLMQFEGELAVTPTEPNQEGGVAPATGLMQCEVEEDIGFSACRATFTFDASGVEGADDIPDVEMAAHFLK